MPSWMGTTPANVFLSFGVIPEKSAKPNVFEDCTVFCVLRWGVVMSLTPQAARGPQATTAVPVLQPGHPEALAGVFSFPSLLLKRAFS